MGENGNGRGESYAVCEEMTVGRILELVEQGDLSEEQRVLVMLSDGATLSTLRRAKLERARIEGGRIHWQAAVR